MGETYGGNRPQRGFMKGYRGLLRDYRAIYNTIMMSEKRYWIFLKIENLNLSSGAYLLIYFVISKKLLKFLKKQKDVLKIKIEKNINILVSL